MTTQPDGNWEMVEITPLYRRSRLWMDKDAGTYILRTEHFADEAIQALNAEERNARDTKRWSAGAGSEKGGNVPMVRVARTPINKFMADVAPYIRAGDDEHQRWWLNSDAALPFRTKSGRL